MAGLEGRRPDFEAARATVLAINPAPLGDHRAFAEQRGLHFPILSDPGGRVTRAFGCRVPIVGLVRRTVYALNPKGRVIFAERGQADLKKVLETIRTTSRD